MELFSTFFITFLHLYIQKSMAIENFHKINGHSGRRRSADSSSHLKLSTVDSTAPRVIVDFDSPLFIHDKLELECNIHLRPDQVLYSVKWYKDDKEFFVYLPLESRSTRFYPMKGVHFDTPSYSHINQSLFVWLRNINLDTQGIYQCEVSTDAPVVPSRGPRISGSRSNFGLKNRIDLNCTTPRSRPLPTLQWLINDQPASNDYLTHYSRTNHSDGLSSRTLRLRFTITEQHYLNGNMQLKCVASYKKLQMHGGVTRRHSKLNQQRSSDLLVPSGGVGNGVDSSNGSENRKKVNNKLNNLTSKCSNWRSVNSCIVYQWMLLVWMLVYMATTIT